MRKFSLVFVGLSLLFGMTPAFAQERSFTPMAGFSYHFGTKNKQPLTALYFGYSRKSHDSSVASFTSTLKLASWQKIKGDPAQVSIAGMPLNSNGGLNAESNNSGMSTTKKVAIGVGIAVGALYLLMEKTKDSIDDAVDDGEFFNGADGSPNEQEQSGPLCVPVGVQC